MLDDRSLELTRASELSVKTTIDANCLLFPVAADEAVATALLRGTAST